jgi:hypothetical protein
MTRERKHEFDNIAAGAVGDQGRTNPKLEIRNTKEIRSPNPKK